jgi:hypothetical protein
MTTITEAAYAEAVDQSLGWCPECESFTRDCTEPDASGYDCPICEMMGVMGAEQALVEGVIDFGEGES